MPVKAEPPQCNPETGNKLPVKLLYLEDDEMDRRAFLRMVRQNALPYDVTLAESLAQAHARLAESHFDVILADYHLPDGHCTELFEQVLDIPFIVMTGTLEESLALRTLEGGADDYLPKMRDGRHLEALPVTIEKTLRRKHLHEREQSLTRELLESEERFRLLVESVADYAIYTLDCDGCVTTWNVGAERIKGWKAEEILGRNFSLFFLPEDVAAGKPQRELQIAARAGSFQEQARRLRKDGSIFWADVTINAVKDDRGKVIGFGKVIRDITVNKVAEEWLRQSEQRFRALVMATEEVVYIMSPDWSEMRQLQGGNFLPDTESANSNWFQKYIPPEDQPRVQAAINDAIGSRSNFELEHRVRRADGEMGWTLSRAIPLLDSKGEIQEWFGAARDITARKRAEEMIQRRNLLSESINRLFRETLACETEEQLGSICLTIAEELTQSQCGFIGKLNTEGRLDDIATSDPGRAACKMLIKEGHPDHRTLPAGFEIHGIYGRVMLSGKGFFTNDPPSHLDSVGLPSGYPPVAAFMGAPLTQGDKSIGMIAVENRPGGYSQVHLEALEELAAAIVPVLMRFKAEQALRQTQEQLRTITDNMAAGVTRCSRDQRYLWVSPAYARWIGRAPKEIIGRPLPEVIGAAGYETIQPYIQQVLKGQRVEFETQVNYLGIGNVWIHMVYTPTHDALGVVDGWIAVVSDITERKKAEAEIAALHDRLAIELQGMKRLHELSTRFVHGDDLKTLLDSILDTAIAITNADKGNIQLFNVAFGELDVAAYRGFDQTFVDFFSHIRPGVAACGTAMQTRQCVVVEDVTLSPLFLAAPRALELMVANGVRAAVCTPLLTRTGRLIGVLSTHYAVPCRPSERDLHLLDLLARQAADFVERLSAEQALQVARQDLAQANTDLERKVQERTATLQQTVEELEHFSYTITHDMRAPLRAMQGFAHLILEGESAANFDSTTADQLGRIKMAAARMDALITDSLQYSQILRERFPMKPVDVKGLLRGLLESYPNLQLPHAEVHLDGEFPRVMGNEAGLTQCFSNLLTNATKFVPPGSTPQVRVWAEPRGDFVRLWVEDNGIGIPKEYQNRIWEMFQRLEKSHEGTGIGLSLVRKAVSRMNGRVGVESEPGAGSRFWVELKRIVGE